MYISDALTAIESMLPKIKDGSLHAELLDYHYKDNKYRFVINSSEGFFTYLNIHNEDGSFYSVFESFTCWDADLNEMRVGDQWNPLIELSEYEQQRFNAALAAFFA